MMMIKETLKEKNIGKPIVGGADEMISKGYTL
jgi:hypothetical protein